MHDFIANVPQFIQEMTTDKFIENVISAVNKKIAPLPSLTDVASHLWGHVEDRRFLFDEVFLIAEILTDEIQTNAIMMQSRIADFSAGLLLGSNRRLLAVHASTLFSMDTITNPDSAHMDQEVEPIVSITTTASSDITAVMRVGTLDPVIPDTSQSSQQMVEEIASDYDLDSILQHVQGIPIICHQPCDIHRL